MKFPVSATIEIPRAEYNTMAVHVARLAPEEACGLLAGVIEGDLYRVDWTTPITNMLRSPVRYQMDPHEQLRAFERIDTTGMKLVGIYHSHPHGPRRPSPTDLAEAYYPEAAYLIWSEHAGEWECAAFRLLNGNAYSIEIVIFD